MQDFLKNINAQKTKQAFYHLFDFHVHSLASKDVLIEKRSALSEKEQDLIKNVTITNNTSAKEAEELVLKEQNIIENYYELLTDHVKGIVENNEWSLIAITDHNVFRLSSELSSYSIDSERLKQNKLIIIPGVELEVEFPFKDDENISCHILFLFEPNTDYTDILFAIKNINNGKWSYGEKLKVDSIEKFISEIRHHEKTCSIAISAHINSTKGIRGEAKMIFTKLEARIAKLSSNEDENRIEIDSLKKKLPLSDSYEYDILNLIGKCGFDALQVANQGDNYYFSKINKINKELGRSNPALFSDAHKISDIFNINNEFHPYLKLNEISAKLNTREIFKDITASLRLGESRITYSPIEKSTYWIDGIRLQTSGEKTNNFWPNLDTSQECIIPFSRNLNCLIGGRGSGKSAIIEALCFVFDKQDEYNLKSNKDKDWFSRADRVLSNCTIETLSRYLDSENSNKKKALIHKRSFYSDSTNKKSEVYNIDNESVDTSKFLNLPSVDYYRFNEIEEYTKPEKLRKLFDDICGKEIEIINQEIKVLETQLHETKKEIVELAKAHKKIIFENAPIKEYVKRFLEYEKANKPEIKSKFEKLDNVESSETKMLFLDREYKKINVSSISSFAKTYSNFIQELNLEKDKNSEYEYIVESLNKAFSDGTNISEELENTINIVDSLIDSIEDRFDEIALEIARRLEIAKKELRDNNIDPEEDYRQNCKTNFEESEELFEEYKQITNSFLGKIDERYDTYSKLKQLSEKRSSIRQSTAQNITESLAQHLDERVIIIEAQANVQSDKESLESWLKNNLFASGTQQTTKRLKTLNHLTIDNCLKCFFIEKDFENELFRNNIQLVSDGKINTGDAELIMNNNIVLREFKFSELNEIDPNDQELLEKLPQDIKDGLIEINVNNLSKFLDLYTLSNNDEPVILLNDRPLDTTTKRNIKNLSPGQRCSAILPIILINGEGPLIIDQPEDNLDNKLVREVIVNILSRIKLKRQVIIATHNPNLPVLGDAENVIALQAKGEGQCEFLSLGSLDEKETVTSITEIMEGGREAFQYRSSLYEEHWQEGAEK
jgi:predicted ATPase